MILSAIWTQSGGYTRDCVVNSRPFAYLTQGGSGLPRVSGPIKWFKYPAVMDRLSQCFFLPANTAKTSLRRAKNVLHILNTMGNALSWQSTTGFANVWNSSIAQDHCFVSRSTMLRVRWSRRDHPAANFGCNLALNFMPQIPANILS